MASKIPISETATPFEDIIDGYFSLRESLRQMMVRNGFSAACVTLTHAPILNIPALAPEAPVPLRLDHGTAGIVDRLDLIVTLERQALRLAGYGRWRWYAEETPLENAMPPSTRLAEPAIVEGLGLTAPNDRADIFGAGAFSQKTDFVIYRKT